MCELLEHCHPVGLNVEVQCSACSKKTSITYSSVQLLHGCVQLHVEQLLLECVHLKYLVRLLKKCILVLGTRHIRSSHVLSLVHSTPNSMTAQPCVDCLADTHHVLLYFSEHA